MMKTTLVWISAISGLIAAVLWFIATVIKVDYKEIMKNGFVDAAITENENGRQIDILLTAKQQTLWNRWAALVTGLSMLAQSISLML
jgi:hypothetical protein